MGGHFKFGAALFVGATAFLIITTIARAADPRTVRVSVGSSGRQGNGHSGGPSLSASGLSIAFVSTASTLVPGDTNGKLDVFVHGVQGGQTKRVSVSSSGRQGNGDSQIPVISADGRFVTFSSSASNLVPDDTNGGYDIFIHERATAKTTRISVGADGAQANSESIYSVISGNGRYVAFQSFASNLVANDTNGLDDVFVRDREKGTTLRISVAENGDQGIGGRSDLPAISDNGQVVAFLSDATNLVSNDTNGHTDIFVRDLAAGTTTRVSVSAKGAQANNINYMPAISANGRFVAFVSEATNLVPSDTSDAFDVFVYDRAIAKLERVSIATNDTQANFSSYAPVLSADGRLVAFWSDASNLVPNNTNAKSDIFVRDRIAGTTRRVSLTTSGLQGNGDSDGLTLSANGGLVGFESMARNLVPGDTNGKFDTFVRRR